MENENRNRIIKFRVNDEEYSVIKKRLEVCEVTSMSELFRQMMLHGIYLEYDHEELKKYNSPLQVQQITLIRLHSE